jgi:hypothetical protein
MTAIAALPTVATRPTNSTIATMDLGRHIALQRQCDDRARDIDAGSQAPITTFTTVATILALAALAAVARRRGNPAQTAIAAVPATAATAASATHSSVPAVHIVYNVIAYIGRSTSSLYADAMCLTTVPTAATVPTGTGSAAVATINSVDRVA